MRADKNVLPVLYYPVASDIILSVVVLALDTKSRMIWLFKRIGEVAVFCLSRARLPCASKVIVVNITLMADLLCPCLVLLFFVLSELSIKFVGVIVLIDSQRLMDPGGDRLLGVRDRANLLAHHRADELGHHLRVLDVKGLSGIDAHGLADITDVGACHAVAGGAESVHNAVHGVDTVLGGIGLENLGRGANTVLRGLENSMTSSVLANHAAPVIAEDFDIERIAELVADRVQHFVRNTGRCT